MLFYNFYEIIIKINKFILILIREKESYLRGKDLDFSKFNILVEFSDSLFYFIKGMSVVNCISEVIRVVGGFVEL